MKKPVHESVMVEEILTSFSSVALKTMVDGTLGYGGHAQALLKAHPENTCYYGFDQDAFAIKVSQEVLAPYPQMRYVHQNFSTMSQHVQKTDGVLLDLGVSSVQLDQAERGFSFRHDGPLDMRMDQSAPQTAYDVIHTYSESELAHIFFRYGEEKRARTAARVLVKARQHQTIETTGQLKELLTPYLRSRHETKDPLTRVFQALRIEVNQELAHLERFLAHCVDLLNPGAIVAIISFHSLEDRLVKNALEYYAQDKESTRGVRGCFIEKTPTMRWVTKKPLRASDQEVARNPRSRSARLRVAQKI